MANGSKSRTDEEGNKSKPKDRDDRREGEDAKELERLEADPNRGKPSSGSAGVSASSGKPNPF